MRNLRSLGAAAVAALPIVTLGAVPAAAPAVSTLRAETLLVGGIERTFEVYVPDRRAVPAAAVVALHGGSGGSGARLRGFLGGELERLADEHGFLVAYPNGWEGSWNGCRAGAEHPASRAGIDDLAFLDALFGRLVEGYGADPRRIVLAGFSNGAHLAYRAALERPERVRGIAAFAANLPAADALDCAEARRPVAALLVAGTADAINPFAGGAVALPDGTRLGTVRSAEETLIYFGRLAGYREPPGRIAAARLGLPEGAPVEARGWIAGDGADVVLLVVPGGGHAVPSPTAAFPPFLGRVERGFSAVAAALRLFGLAGER